MKRLLSLVLVLALVLGVLASCDLPFDLPFFNNTPEEADIQGVVKELDDMYKAGNGTSIQNGYELIAQYKLGGTMFTITWTSDNEDIKIELVDGLYVVTLPNNTSGQSEYNLIATITSAGGQTATVKYNRVLAESFGMITNPVAGTAYKLALLHGNEKAVVYFNGNNYNNYAWYFAYTTDVLASPDVYLEAVEGVEGGYRLYFDKDGVKTYIVAFPRDGDTTQGTLKFDTTCPSEYFTYSTEYNTLVYTSVTGATNYPCRLYGVGGVEEKLPEQKLPELPENPTVKDIIEASEKLQVGQTLEVSFKFTAKITGFKYAFDAGYNNVSPRATIEGKEVVCFRISGEGADTIKVGDTITVFVSGITRYSETEWQTLAGGVLEAVVPGEGGETGGETGGDTTTADATLNLTGNANLVSGSADQNVFAQNGITFTNDKASSSSDLVVQASYAQRAYAGSTVKIEYPGMTKIVITFDDYSPDGTKNYMSGFDGMTVAGATLTRDNDVLTIVFDAATDVFQSSTLASQVRIEKIEVYTGEVEGGGNSGDNGGNGGNETVNYPAPEANQAYNLYMVLPSGVVYFNGSLDAEKSSYLDTTTDANASVVIYFEVVSGGYNIYFMNGDVKTYINAEAYLKSNGYAGCHFTLDATANTVWTYDTTNGVLEVYGEIEGKNDTFFAGTYGSYSTVSLSGAYYKDQIATGTQFPARISLASAGEVTPPAHEHNFVNGECACGEKDPTYVPPVVSAELPGSLSFGSLANKADGDAYMAANFPEWTITGKLGAGYGGYIGFGRSNSDANITADKNSAITSSAFSTSTAFTVTAVIKGNGSNGVMTSTLTFTLIDADGNTVATGYANGSSTAAITPVDATDTTYDISFTFVEGKTWTDVSNLVVTFAKATGNIGLKSLDFYVAD